MSDVRKRHGKIIAVNERETRETKCKREGAKGGGGRARGTRCTVACASNVRIAGNDTDVSRGITVRCSSKRGGKSPASGPRVFGPAKTATMALRVG